MPNSRFDVLGIGNAIVDVIARCDEDFLSRFDLPKGHMQLIDSDRAEALYAAMGPTIEISGGSAANTCAGLAAFGARAALIGKVADDHFGTVFGHDLRAAGVTYETPPAKNGTSAPTARSFILVTPDGERTMNTFLGACMELGNGEVDPNLVSAARITYLEGYLFDPPDARAAFHRAAEIAGAAGRKVALSLSDSFCVERHRAAFRSLIQGGVDLLFANEDEICALYEVSHLTDAIAAVRSECDLAAITRGAAGSVIITPEDTLDIPAHPVAEVVDTTGAGDLYAAGFLYGYATGKDLGDCGRLAALAAAEIISHMGARPEKNLEMLAQDTGLI